MRKIKAILAMCLAFLIAFSTVGVLAEETTAATQTAAEEASQTAKFSDITAGSKTEEAVVKLVAYNIISGYPDGTFKPDNSITRAEFATVIAKFKKIGSGYGTDVKTGFSDLDADEQNAWARPYVKAAVDAKIINGFEDGTFRASEPVTYEQAVKMIICAIEYDVIATSEYNRLMATNPETTTWSSGYIAAANKNSITLNAISAQITQPTTRGIVAILTSNALSAPKLNIDANGGVSKDDKETQDDSKIEIDGYVTGTPYTGVDEQNPDVSFGEIEIQDKDGKKVYELSSALSESIDYHDILGKKVTAYYTKADRVISQLTTNEKVVDSVVINEKDIDVITASEIKYVNENGKPLSISVGGYKVIYNGKYMESLTADDLKSGTYEFKNGFIEAMDCGSNSLLKVTSFDVRVVNSYDKSNEKIFFKYEDTPNNFYQAPARTSDKPVVIFNGKSQEFDNFSFSQYDVLNFLESPAAAAGNKVNIIYVTRGMKTGEVDGKDADNGLITMGDVDYRIAYNYENYTGAGASGNDIKAPFEHGQSYNFYLDYTGQIAAVKYSATSGGSYKYGYLILADKVDGKYMVRLVTETGVPEDPFEVKDSLKLDGDRIQASSLLDKLYESAQIANAGYNAQAASWGASALSGEYYCQPVRYSTSGGKIDGIDTVKTVEGNSEDILSLDVKLENGKTNVKSSSTLVQGSTSFGASSGTKVIYVPDRRNSKADYALLSSSTAFASYTSGSNKVELNLDVFNIDQGSSKTAGLIVIYGNNPTYVFKDSSPYMVVTDKKRDGEVIVGYVQTTSSETKELTVSEDKFIVDDAKGWIPASDVDEGDIIRYFTDNGKVDGQIIAIQMIYDASNPSQKASVASAADAKALRVKSFDDDSTTNRHFRYGTPISVVNNDSEKVIQLTYMVDDDTATADEISNIEYSINYKIGSSTKIYEIDGEKVNVLETIDTIYDMSTSAPSRVLTVASYESDTTATVVYVIR